MKLEDQVCSLELSKKLKELGVKQESYFDWYSVKGDREKDYYVSSDDAGYGYKLCSAFTVAEMGEMLPNEMQQKFGTYYLKLEKRRLTYMRPNDFYQDVLGEQLITGDTEADARAKMLIYLIEHGFVKP